MNVVSGAAANGQLGFWSRPLPDLLAALETDGAGLDSAEAKQRFESFGPNSLEGPSPVIALVSVLRRAVNPLVLILLAASIVSAFVGELVNASIIASMVFFSGAIDVFQTHRSQKAAEQLRRRVEAKAAVRRDGVWRDLPLREVVPADVIRLQSGDLVPADARLLVSNHLMIDEATFTGESLPVEKAPGEVEADVGVTGASNALFMGTTVASGNGEAVVVHTGRSTAFARIAAELQHAPPQTAFERGLARFGLLIGRTVVVLVLFVMAVNLLAHRPFLDSLLFAIALAVGLTPEFLPMILSVTQAQGALKMAKARVIVRQLASIQNLGNMDIICSDKTGTLTRGEMSVVRVIDAGGRPSARVGLLAYLNATLQTDIRSAFDSALGRESPAEGGNYEAAGELPFDFERRRLSVAVKSEGERLLISKGAPESVLSVSTSKRQESGLYPLDEEGRDQVLALIGELGSHGFRLLAVSSREVPASGELSLADESQMVFEGLIAFSDQPKEGVEDVIRSLAEDAVRLMVLTGDAEPVTRYVCGAIGMPVDRIITGDMLDALLDDALSEELERTSVFARVSPDQKLRIIKLLQARGHVVGYLGDGINDAPSLRAADVGISVSEAVDIAREAAQIVLLEKSLRVLHDGIVEGRKVFGNVMKYIMMGTSSNFGNMLSMAGAVLVLPFLPLLPSQVLINNALYDFAQVSIPTDKVDEEMVRKPRGWDMRFIRDFMLVFGPLSSVFDFLTFYVLRHVFNSGEELFHTGWFVESLATQTLVILVIRTAGNPLHSRPSIWLTGTVISVVTIGCLLPLSPLAATIGFTQPPLGFVVFLAVAVAAYLVLIEAAKRVFYRFHPLA